MKKFEVLRYLKKFSLVVFLISAVGVAFTWWYTKNYQKYTASAVIQYTNQEIEQGLAPDGTKLDVNEIYSSTVISQTMDYLNQNGPLNIIRSRCNVEEVISDEQKAINEAITDKGEKVTYFPDTYKVNLVVDGDYGEQYARNVLDVIIQSYCTYYTERYVEQKLSLNPSAALLESGYDYYECVRILENDTNNMIEFLKKKKDDHPDFRSSKTGYSYADLYEIYVQFKNYVIPELYANVLNGPQVKDGEVLKNHIANDIATSKQEDQVKTEQREKISALIDNFVNKNLGMPGERADGDTIESDYILKEIEEHAAGSSTETTYDGLVLEVVGIDKFIASDRIDRAFNQENLKKFKSVKKNTSGTEKSHAKMEKLINDYEKELTDYYEIVSETGKELNLCISTDYLKMVSTVRVYPAVNARLYMILAVVLFFIVGCIGAIILGRVEDIALYMLYTDKKTGLPNRDKLNVYIDSLTGKLLPDDFTCISVKLENLGDLTKRFGYSVGDDVLRDFADIIKILGDTQGEIGYNGVGMYDIFFDKCNDKKAAVILRILDEQVEAYNNVNTDYPIQYKAASATSTVEGIYDIRALIRCAKLRLNQPTTSDEEEKK